MKKEDRISPVDRTNQEKKSEEKIEKKPQENMKEICKTEKSETSTPERSDKSKKGPKSSGAKKSQDVPKKLKQDDVYSKTPGRNTEIKKTALSKELEKEKDEFDFSDGESPSKKGPQGKGKPQKVSQFQRKSKDNNNENILESNSQRVEEESKLSETGKSKAEGTSGRGENGNDLMESIKRIMQDDDDIPNIKKQKLSEEEHKKSEISQLNETQRTVENVDRDDEMLFHQEECKKSTESEDISNSEADQPSKPGFSKKKGKLKKHKKGVKTPPAPESDTAKQLTPRKREEKYRCNKCHQQFRKEEKFDTHVGKCTGDAGMILNKENDLNTSIEEKLADTNGETQTSEDSLDDKKSLLLEKNVAITIVNEDNVDHLRDTKIIEGKEEKEGNDDVPVNVESPVVEPPKEVITPRKGRGRPKKILEISKILEQVPPSPPPPTLSKRTSSTSRRTSSSSRTSTLSTGAVTSLSSIETSIPPIPITPLSETATVTSEAVPSSTVSEQESNTRKIEPSTATPNSTAQPNKSLEPSQAEPPAQAPISNTRPKRSRKVIDKDL